jgi:hypothetical protein
MQMNSNPSRAFRRRLDYVNSTGWQEQMVAARERNSGACNLDLSFAAYQYDPLVLRLNIFRRRDVRRAYDPLHYEIFVADEDVKALADRGRQAIIEYVTGVHWSGAAFECPVQCEQSRCSAARQEQTRAGSATHSMVTGSNLSLVAHILVFATVGRVALVDE